MNSTFSPSRVIYLYTHKHLFISHSTCTGGRPHTTRFNNINNPPIKKRIYTRKNPSSSSHTPEPQLMDTPFSGTVIEAPREQVVKSGTTITFSCRAAFEASPAFTAERSLSSSDASSSLRMPPLRASSKLQPSPFNDNKTNNHSTKHAIWSVNGQPIRAKVNIHIKWLAEVERCGGVGMILYTDIWENRGLA